MSVPKTNKMVREFIEKRNEALPEQIFQLQREIICEPIADHFEEYHAMQLQKYFLDNGLFFPNANLEDEIKQLEKKMVWEIVEKQYEKLRKEWHGEKATIYIFPVERRNEMIMKHLKGKMGISFHNVIVLFVTKELSEQEIQALITHEYNHVCRLSALQKSFNELTLLDSMIIEGMAEVAVEQTDGKEMLAPWVHMHTKEKLDPYWLKVQSYLELQGKDKHDVFLYGNKGTRGFPQWFGYSIGYLLVKSYIKNNQGMKMKTLLKKDTLEIVCNSEYHLP